MSFALVLSWATERVLLHFSAFTRKEMLIVS